jgi:hypothetical protein
MGVRLFEQPQVFLHVEPLFEQCFRIPFAAGSGKKIPAIGVDGARESRQRISYRVDDVAPEGLDIPFPSDFAPAASMRPPSSSGRRRQKILSSRPV